MSWWTAPCDCGPCTLANTQAVVFAAKGRVPGKRLHGAEARRFQASRERGLSRISEIAERLRTELGIKAQRGDE